MYKSKILISELNHHSPQSRRSRALAQALPTLNRRWNSSSHKPAFTIIEVVLVLAIAGLIFLMVFIALPALQQSQRDIRRKQDLSKLADAFERYKSNNRGAIPPLSDLSTGEQITVPASSSSFARSYLNAHLGEFNDPSGTIYLLRPSYSDRDIGYKPASPYGTIYITASRKCSADGASILASGLNNYTIQMQLENGGFYCLDG